MSYTLYILSSQKVSYTLFIRCNTLVLRPSIVAKWRGLRGLAELHLRVDNPRGAVRVEARLDERRAHLSCTKQRSKRRVKQYIHRSTPFPEREMVHICRSTSFHVAKLAAKVHISLAVVRNYARMSQTVVRLPFAGLEQCPNGGCKR